MGALERGQEGAGVGVLLRVKVRRVRMYVAEDVKWHDAISEAVLSFKEHKASRLWGQASFSEVKIRWEMGK